MAPRKAPEKNILSHGNEAKPEVEKPAPPKPASTVSASTTAVLTSSMREYICTEFAVKHNLKREDLRNVLIMLQSVPKYMLGPRGDWTRAFPPGG